MSNPTTPVWHRYYVCEMLMSAYAEEATWYAVVDAEAIDTLARDLVPVLMAVDVALVCPTPAWLVSTRFEAVLLADTADVRYAVFPDLDQLIEFLFRVVGPDAAGVGVIRTLLASTGCHAMELRTIAAPSALMASADTDPHACPGSLELTFSKPRSTIAYLSGEKSVVTSVDLTFQSAYDHHHHLGGSPGVVTICRADSGGGRTDRPELYRGDRYIILGGVV